MWGSRVYNYIYHWDVMNNEVSVQDMIPSATKILLEGLAPAV